MNTTAIKERPILFSAPMIQALLDGRKTQTRRIVKPSKKFLAQVDDMESSWVDGYSHMSVTQEGFVVMHGEGDYLIECPYGKHGDRLWVKETHALLYQQSECPVIAYRADDSARIVFTPPEGKFTLAGQAGEAASTWRAENIRWRPSIHMPRWASRITLEITDVRVQRVEEVGEQDALAEGVRRATEPEQHAAGYSIPRVDANLFTVDGKFISISPREVFLNLFYDINKRAKRGENPWVWALTFKRIA